MCALLMFVKLEAPSDHPAHQHADHAAAQLCAEPLGTVKIVHADCALPFEVQTHCRQCWCTTRVGFWVRDRPALAWCYTPKSMLGRVTDPP